jgi:hypothetical protein
MSGTTLTNFSDAAPSPERSYSCACLADYAIGRFRFLVRLAGSQCGVREKDTANGVGSSAALGAAPRL